VSVYISESVLCSFPRVFNMHLQIRANLVMTSQQYLEKATNYRTPNVLFFPVSLLVHIHVFSLESGFPLLPIQNGP
jgi:hypothetical protein